MFEQQRDHLRNVNKQIKSLYSTLVSDIESDIKLYEREHKNVTSRSVNLLSELNKNLYKSKDMINGVERNSGSVTTLSSSFTTFLDDKIKCLKTQSNSRIQDIGKKLSQYVGKKDISVDTTNAFLRQRDIKTDITNQLDLMNKHLNLNVSSGSSISSHTVEKVEKSSSFLPKALMGLGVVGLGKKLIGSKGAKVAGKTLKYGKKLIPFAGIAFSLWDLASDLKTGYSDYQKYSMAGNTNAAKSVLGYTAIGAAGNLLSLFGSVAASTGLGLPIALAIDAVSMGLDLYSDHLKSELEVREANPRSVKTVDLKEMKVNKPQQPTRAPNINTKDAFRDSNKLIKDTNKLIKKSLTVTNDKLDDKWYENIMPDMFSSNGSSSDGLGQGPAKLTKLSAEDIKKVKSGFDYIKDPNIRKQAVAVSFAESGFHTTAYAGDQITKSGKRLGGAMGLYQFIPSTWNGMIKTHKQFAGYTLADRADPIKASLVYEVYQKENNRAVDNYTGGRSTLADYYMANFMGVGGRGKVGSRDFYKAYKSNPNMLGVDLADPGAVRNNPGVFYHDKARTRPKTVGEIYAYAAKKMSEGQNYIGKFSKGTNKIEKNGLALVHKDEMIIPNKNAAKIRSVMEARHTVNYKNDDDLSEDFWINTFMVALADVVKSEYLGSN